MSSSIIDSTSTTAIPTSAAREGTHHSLHRAWLVAVALVAATTLGLSLAWQASSHASPTVARAASVPAAAEAQTISAASAGAGLLAMAWELTPTSQQDSACAQFAADPAAAWAAYSSAGDPASIATAAEFAAFLRVRC